MINIFCMVGATTARVNALSGSAVFGSQHSKVGRVIDVDWPGLFSSDVGESCISLVTHR